MELDRSRLIAWYQQNRSRTESLFELVSDRAYYSRPIALRHPLVFYDGHLPAFSFNTLVKKALGGPSIDARLERLFARGIDPDETRTGRDVRLKPDATSRRTTDLRWKPDATSRRTTDFRLKPDATSEGRRDATEEGWPDRDTVRAFVAEADARVVDALEHADLDRPGDPFLDGAEAVFTILEHEAMHHETMLYMWHRLPLDEKTRPAGYTPQVDGRVPAEEWIEVPAGDATLGASRSELAFGWDNERPSARERVPAFTVQRHDVTNAQFLEFVEAGGYGDRRWWRPEDWAWIQDEGVTHPMFWEKGTEWLWRGMFDRLPLPPSWPVYVSYAEAAAYARWRGHRLLTEAEYQRAAFGAPATAENRPHPWGEAAPTAEHGVFDFSSWDPEPAGSHQKGRSAWGIDDLVGNGWEWTSTPFAPFDGFRPMASYPEYSADFFDGQHFVIKGASPATAGALLRPTFRNWFRGRYPYVYATFRCAADR
jgi:iron(II)-dependent oxidoreductase